MDITSIRQLNAQVEREALFLHDLLADVNTVMVGQETMVERVLIALLADGHILLEGVPGLAKTLLIKTMAQAIQADFSRIQFTPDLLPADLVGTQMYNLKTGEFTVHQGPLFANFVLADEINRAPAKVQSALLEAMQERQITIGNTTYQMEDLFLVLATQNPIEQEGTYPLPEAQVDRFMLKVIVDYPKPNEERLIIDRMTGDPLPPVNAVVSPAAAPAGARDGAPCLCRRQDQELCAEPGPGHPRSGQQWPVGPAALYRLWRLAARGHQPDAGGTGPRLYQGPWLCHARRHQRDRARRAAPPRHRQLRGRGRERHQRRHRAAHPGLCRGTLTDVVVFATNSTNWTKDGVEVAKHRCRRGGSVA